jgi:Bor protein
MNLGLRALLPVVCAVSMGCYHASVETGAEPSTEVINKSFASGWIYGLVPPSTISTAAKCPNGAAKVETQQSFVNGVVRILTLGIYTPMQVTVTCAATSKTAVNATPTQDIAASQSSN